LSYNSKASGIASLIMYSEFGTFPTSGENGDQMAFRCDWNRSACLRADSWPEVSDLAG